MSDLELINKYRETLGSYEAAQSGAGDRVGAFIDFLVWERALMASLGLFRHSLIALSHQSE